MHPEISAAWRRILRALSRVKTTLKAHNKNQQAAALVEAELARLRRRR